ncbi:MAG: hypothetical protein IJR28_03425 [Ottowia sp.]|nr:hypothetical protein [Ottowia sp.]
MSSSTLTLDEALAPYSAAARQAGVALPALLTALMEDASAVQRALGRLVKGGAAASATDSPPLQKDDDEAAEINRLKEEVLAHARAVSSGEKQPQPDARARLAQSVRAIWEEVARSGQPEMTMDEINAEIAAARRERRERERAAA